MTVARSIWDVVFQPAQVDPEELARAIARDVSHEPLDFRTRLLIRDSVEALTRYWGSARVDAWVESLPERARIDKILRSDDLGGAGFPSLARRIMEPTRQQDVLDFLREASAHVSSPTRLVIGGSIALILAGHLSRHTEDLAVVDEVPHELRTQHELIDQLASRYGLRLTHFQSHYLPTDWKQRIRSVGRMGKLDVFIVDEYDVAISKLFSPRERDRDDLRVLVRRLDRAMLTPRLTNSAGAFVADPALRAHAEKNWYVIYGHQLPA